MKKGAPLKFETVEELTEKIEKYFNSTPITEWTVTGLAIALDTFRSVLCDYASGKYDDDRDFSNTVKKAKQMVEHSYELDLKKFGRSGTIFALKNFDWKDKTEVDQSIAIKTALVEFIDEPNTSQSTDTKGV